MLGSRDPKILGADIWRDRVRGCHNCFGSSPPHSGLLSRYLCWIDHDPALCRLTRSEGHRAKIKL